MDILFARDNMSLSLKFVFTKQKVHSKFQFQLLDAASDEEFCNRLMEDDCFKLLETIGYCGVPTKEKLINREKILK